MLIHPKANAKPAIAQSMSDAPNTISIERGRMLACRASVGSSFSGIQVPLERWQMLSRFFV
jgi:hypothetical protein